MNIGIVCYPTYGGSGVIATELGKSLALRGHKVHFITYSRPIRLGHFTKDITFHEVSVADYPLFEFPPYESALASTLVDVAQYHDIDLFHVHYAIPHASAGILARNILKEMGRIVPVITTLHGTDITLVGKSKVYEPVVAWSINHSDGTTAVSDWLRQETNSALSITTPIEVIPNFVDLERFQRQDKEHFRKMVASNNEKIIIHTSNFRKVKRVEDVILAYQRIKKDVPSKLLMIGDGPERPRVEELCRELNLCNSIVFLGYQNPVEEIYSIADLFLMPSASESFGLSALEVMACGVPCITSNAGGLPEVNLDGKTGFVCEIGDTDCMGEKAVELLRDDALWQKFSRQARSTAEEYSIDKIVPLYETYYQKVLKSAKSLV
ncbi:MAG TPA: N-acetyl-alpha-D-glucosaminyl L-malate synthase BshA [Bacteroidetes bacterium]|nr:N-acetyl-alpha-D-glucosaminyl L-malate synthase BshA [Bacteroidota bacterium]